MSTQDTITIALPKSGKRVAITSYYPYGASQATQAIFLANAKLDMSSAIKDSKAGVTGSASESIKMDEIDGTVIKLITDEKIKYMVKAVDEVTYPKDELLAVIYDLPASDVEKIKDEITRIEDADSVDGPKEPASPEPTL